MFSLSNGCKIPRLVPTSRATMLSAEVGNRVIDALNSWLQVRIVRGAFDHVFITQNNVIIQLKEITQETQQITDESQNVLTDEFGNRITVT